MQYNDPYASPAGSFVRPVLPPVVDPDASPTRSITVSCAWLPFIRGALSQLILQSTWQGTPDQVRQAQDRAMTLISLFTECSTVEFPFACDTDLELHGPSPWGTWAANCLGVYEVLQGWVSTRAACPDCWYAGIRLDITLPALTQISDFALIYDMDFRGHVGGCDDTIWLRVTDVDNSALIGTPLHESDMASGTGLTYHTGFNTHGETQHLQVLIIAAEAETVDALPLASCEIRSVAISGSSSHPPC